MSSRQLRSILVRFAFVCVSGFVVSACKGGTVTVPLKECSPTVPTGTCPDGQSCVNGACQASVQNGDPCTQNSECASAACIASRCRGDHCGNGFKDGDETGVDCGGADCGSCPGAPCTSAGTCQSGTCGSNQTCSVPTCTDGIKNGDETDIDCGGSCTLAQNGHKTCGTGHTCDVASDCTTNVCNVTCQAPASHCTNGVVDGGETGLNCGGGECPACADGGGCTASADCTSGICGVGNSCPSTCTCQAPGCADGVKNGDETGVDCGGACTLAGNGSKTCSNGTGCNVDSDCASGVCNGTCQAPASHCSNSTKDGTETGVDCGGPECTACANGQGCATGGDCVNGICGVGNSCPGPALCSCIAPSCTDGVKNGTETGTDCGGSCALVANGSHTCAAGIPCGAGTDCSSGVCNVTCQSPACPDGVQNEGETGLDCGGPSCLIDCPTGGGCVSGADCVSKVCDVGNTNTCLAPTCSDGVQNQLEKGIDCAGQCLALSQTCGTGTPCDTGADCTSGVCNGTCQAPSCSPPDFVKNGLETDVDCGGLGCPLCANTKSCTSPTDCTSGYCNGSNQCAPCTADANCASNFCSNPGASGVCLATSCNTGIKDGRETGVDCGGPDCAGCGIGGGCLSGTDCQSGYCNGTTCATLVCGDGVIAGAEVCDTAGAGVFPSGVTCGTYGFTSGTLTCSGCNSILVTNCTGGCGNGVKEAGEQCDGAALGGATCQSLGYNNTPGLACTSSCAYDTSACTSSACPGGGCPSGGFCSASTDFLCKCPIYQTMCGSGCISLLTDPTNCGSCGHACGAGQVCASGQCRDSCTAPLLKCGTKCIDPQTDTTFCGAIGNCTGAANDGTNCGASGQVCLSGACAATGSGCPGGANCTGRDYTNAGDAPTRCIGGGPVLDINPPTCDPTVPNDPDCVIAPSQECTGDLASTTFRYAICSCSDIDSSHDLFADGFNSFQAPYTPKCENGATCTTPGSGTDITCNALSTVAGDANGDGYKTCADSKGAGVGANGSYIHTALITVWGTLWLSSGNAATYPGQVITSTVEQQLHIGNTLAGGTSRVRGDGFVVNNITGTTGSFAGTLHQSVGKTSTMSASAYDRTQNPLVVPPACDCAPNKLINVPGIVNAHATNNNNAAIGLVSTILETGNKDVRIDLPCGNYYFTNITAGANSTVTVVVHGRTAIYVNGNIDIPKTLNFQLTDAAELDVFVKGGVCNNDTIYVGSPNYPARVRFYAGGGNLIAGGSGSTCGSNASRAMSLKNIVGAANLYAPYGEVYMPQTFTLFGSIFGGRVNIVQNATFHFDTGVIQAGGTCEHCGDGLIQAGEQCDGNALGGKTCANFPAGCTPGVNCFTGGPLTCGANCTYNTSACTRCGDGVRGAGEQCDGADLGGQTCASLGFSSGSLSCSGTCTFQGCSSSACNNNGVKEGTEQCDGSDFGSATCASVLGISGATGSLTCTNCLISSPNCIYCGDGLRNGSEACDGTDFDLAAGVQNTPPNCPSGTAKQKCSATCTLDTSGCGGGCTSCNDCNNQACNAGVCGNCATSADCCAPLACDPVSHQCTIIF